jgi:hypothetical protein
MPGRAGLHLHKRTASVNAVDLEEMKAAGNAHRKIEYNREHSGDLQDLPVTSMIFLRASCAGNVTDDQSRRSNPSKAYIRIAQSTLQ